MNYFHLLLLFSLITYSVSFAQLVPVRSDPVPQRWDWKTGSASFLIKYAKDNNLRPVDIAILKERPLTFTVVFGDNTGKLEMEWFFYDRLKRHKTDPTFAAEIQGRVNYLIAYGKNRPKYGKLYAALAVKREEQVIASSICLSCLETTLTNFKKKRSTEYQSVSSFDSGEERLYVLSGVVVFKEQIALKRNINVLVRSTEEEIRKRVKSKRTIIVDLHRHNDGLYTVILEKFDAPVGFWWLTAVTPEKIKQEAMLRNARVFDLEPYMLQKTLVYDVLMIQN